MASVASHDVKGLLPGKGDYAAGKQVYETACAACHGADLMGIAIAAIRAVSAMQLDDPRPRRTLDPGRTSPELRITNPQLKRE